MNVFDRAVGFARRIANGIRRRVRNLLHSAYHRLPGVGVNQSLIDLRNDVADLQIAVRGLRAEFTGQLSFLSHDVIAQTNASLTQFFERFDALSSAATDARNRLTHLDTSLHTRFNDVLNVRLPGILEQLHEMSAFELSLGQRMSAERTSTGAKRPALLNVQTFEAVLARVRHDFPTVFDAWKERLDDTAAAIAISETGNIANAADTYSRLFKAFVEQHIAGAVLDVGCGPFGKPYYLAGYPSDLVSGIDPLLSTKAGDIEAVQGISEYLPWPDKSFSTVISATSLDHCISLDRSIDEMVRVLKSDGRILLWLGSNPGSPPYRPLDPNFVAADRYHLFHFDIAWFEPMLEQRFRLIDRVKLDRAGYSHVFYCLGLHR